MRKETDVLEDVPNVAAKLESIPLCREPARHDYDSGIGNEQAVDELQDRALARAAAANHGEYFAGRYGEVQRLDYDPAATRRADTAKLDLDRGGLHGWTVLHRHVLCH